MMYPFKVNSHRLGRRSRQRANLVQLVLFITTFTKFALLLAANLRAASAWEHFHSYDY